MCLLNSSICICRFCEVLPAGSNVRERGCVCGDCKPQKFPNLGPPGTSCPEPLVPAAGGKLPTVERSRWPSQAKKLDIQVDGASDYWSESRELWLKSVLSAPLEKGWKRRGLLNQTWRVPGTCSFARVGYELENGRTDSGGARIIAVNLDMEGQLADLRQFGRSG